MTFEPLGLFTRKDMLGALERWQCDPSLSLPRKGRSLFIAFPNQVAVRITKQGARYLLERNT